MPINTTIVSLEQLVEWGPTRLVDTTRGLRQFRRAVNPPDTEFWKTWKANRVVLKGVGISVNLTDEGEWEIHWWQDAPLDYMERLAKSQSRSADISVPAPEEREYLGYQKAGILYAHRDTTLTTLKRGVLISDEMGLGKTIQAIGIINLHHELRKILIVVPASIKLNWRNELTRWLVGDRTIGVANGSTVPDTDIVIINYDILGRNMEVLQARNSPLMIIDEGHVVRNIKTQKYRNLRPLVRDHVIILTGTPVWNKADDMWALLTLLVSTEDLEKDWDDWKKFRRCKDNPRRQLELNRRLREHIMVRRMKADVLADLPPKRRQVVEVPTTGPAYEAVMAEVMAYRERQARMISLRTAVLLARVNQDASTYHRVLGELRYELQVAFSEMSIIRHKTVLAKLDHIIAHLENLHAEDPTRKIIFFAHHRDVLEIIARRFNAALVYGGMTTERKQAEVDRFQTDPLTWLIAGSIRAMGLGYNITAAWWVVFGELDWTPATVTQCEDRTHRIGQTADFVMIQHLTLDGSLDARMAHVIIEKQTVMDGVTGSLEADEPVVIDMEVELVTVSNKELDKANSTMSPAKIQAVYQAIRTLMACDGFSGHDAPIGQAFAALPMLTARQAVLGKKMVKKYRGQLPQDLYVSIFDR